MTSWFFSMRFRWLIWKLRMKGLILKRFYPSTYYAVHESIWSSGIYDVYHSGEGFLVTNNSGGQYFEEFDDVVYYVIGK